MSSEWELDDGIKSIKSAWQREHTARSNLEKMLQKAEAENEQLRELVRDIWDAYRCEEVAPNVAKHWHDRMRELGVVE